MPNPPSRSGLEEGLPAPRSRARRAARELTVRVLYAMDLSELSAEALWLRGGDSLLYVDGLPVPRTPIAISVEGQLPRLRNMRRAAADDGEAADPHAAAWAQAVAVSEQVASQYPPEISVSKKQTPRIAAELARRWSEAIEEQLEDIDAAIGAASRRWKVARMAPVDRNILRVGAFELMAGLTPPRDVIYDCVELAKRYGEKQTPRFVNGVLDQLCRNQGISL